MKNLYPFSVVVLSIFLSLALQAQEKKEMTDPLCRFRSTESGIFMENLFAQIKSLSQKKARKEIDYNEHLQYVIALWTKGQVYNDIRLIDQAYAESRSLIAAYPKFPGTYIIEAKLLLSLHRFTEGEKVLQQAKLFGADVSLTNALLAEIYWNQGKWSHSVELLKETNATNDFIRSAQKARMFLLTGEIAKADSLMTCSAKLFSDANPFGIAWIYLQWAAVKKAGGDRELLNYCISKAYEKLPQWALVKEAMAERATEEKKYKQALQFYTAIIKYSPDPHPLVEMYKIQSAANDNVAAMKTLQKIDRSYVNLLRSFPEVYDYEAARFYFKYQKNVLKALPLAISAEQRQPLSKNNLLLAQIYLAKGEEELAKKCFNRSLNSPECSVETKSICLETLKKIEKP